MPATSDRTVTLHGPMNGILPPAWLLDLEGLGLEVLYLNGNALVLVDRDPLESSSCGMVADQRGVRGLRGATLTLVGEVEHVSDAVMHGIYSGTIGGIALLMDQYVDCHNGIPRTVVRVISIVTGPRPATVFDLDAYVLRLIEGDRSGNGH